ncbi:(deoxy)nucleoside triphosphate pyrophosphohydrolase [Polaribacter gangjinensis]|uniref:8-oxo-dGTP diphosphatase n=1 Tax=Polaribacter gangjinensis TaxID=574710 RepID=A0A2S7WC60_9FLAO|nr:(deoxy)nucleoside triphosphate pyrophosphohydrolase [Polaribacter gangjinensis]PQJ75210.1 DNA mismatch repair protein MutT [Polaribacter gangjinensis]
MINVTCAIIEHNEKIVVVQRSEFMNLPLKWEFPGGKIENNETEEACIKREIKEELNIEIELISRLSPVTYKYPSFEIKLIPFIAKYINGEINLSEHKQFDWLTKDRLNNLDWAEADIAILKEYQSL